MAEQRKLRTCSLEKNKEPIVFKGTLQSLCHFQVFKMCCDIPSKVPIQNLKKFKESLEDLPDCLMKNLTSDYECLISSSPNFLTNEDENGSRKYYLKFKQQLNERFPSELIDQLKNLSEAQFFNLWFLLFDEKTFIHSIDIQDKEFCSTLIGYLQSEPIAITTVTIWNLQSEMPCLLKSLEKTLISLKVYATEDADVIMNAISESNCQLEEFKFINGKRLDFNARTIMKFLKSQAETMKNLDLSVLLEGIKGEDLDEIVQFIPQMKKLTSLRFDGSDLIDYCSQDPPVYSLHYKAQREAEKAENKDANKRKDDDDDEDDDNEDDEESEDDDEVVNEPKYHRLKYLNIEGLKLHISTTRGDLGYLVSFLKNEKMNVVC